MILTYGPSFLAPPVDVFKWHTNIQRVRRVDLSRGAENFVTNPHLGNEILTRGRCATHMHEKAALSVPFVSSRRTLKQYCIIPKGL
jgi:hypothetical protein